MIKFLICLINIYQRMPFYSHMRCRFYPTCSEYSKQAIEKYGFLIGTFKSLKRIIRCNPFGTSGYDPVPLKKVRKK